MLAHHEDATCWTSACFNGLWGLNDAVDQVRREEQEDGPEVMTNRGKLTKQQQVELDAQTPKSVGLRTARAHHLKGGVPGLLEE